ATRHRGPPRQPGGRTEPAGPPGTRLPVPLPAGDAQPDAAALVGQAALGADLSGAAPRAAGALGQPGRRLRARPGRAGAAEPAALLLTGQLPEGAAAHPAAAQSRSLSGLPARLLALPPGQPRLAGDPQRR